MIVVGKLQVAAFGRADMPEEQRRDFYLYIDEFQNFITPSIATILSEARGSYLAAPRSAPPSSPTPSSPVLAARRCR
jgi:hypothetical protein